MITVNALPRGRAAAGELCSIDSLLKTVRRGDSPAWFALLRAPTSVVTAMEAEGSPGAGEATPKSRWDELCDRYP